MESLAQTSVGIIVTTLRTAGELTLFILLPIMVIMMSLMNVLETRGVLKRIADYVAPALSPFGIDGIGALAIPQLLFVSFAAPAATFSFMKRRGVPRRRIAATLAMILTMSQANAVFPMMAVGLNVPVAMATSLVGGLVAAAATYHLFCRGPDNLSADIETIPATKDQTRPRSFLKDAVRGGQQGIISVWKALPYLVAALFLVNLLDAVGAIEATVRAMSEPLGIIGLPGIAAVPLATKYVAGGSAMMGVTIDLVQEGGLGVRELNRLAGLMINPLDAVGIAVFVRVGGLTTSVILPAVGGASLGIIVRAGLHAAIF